jgi:4-amino-4-deoxy-L-arabinose transferase-like glycosyltransferase
LDHAVIAPTANSRALAIVLAAFAVANAGLWLAASGCRVVGGDCYVAANRWAALIAEPLLRYGRLVAIENPTDPFTAWPPGAGALEALARWVGPDDNIALYVLAQIGMVLAAGLIVRRIVNEVRPPFGDIAMALVVLNPNVLALAHMPQGEVLQMFLLTLALWYVLRFAGAPRLRWALACGALVGLSTLVRPVTLYLCFVLPFALAAVVWAAGRPRGVWGAALRGLAGTLVAIAVLSPWVLHVALAGEGVRIVNRQEEHLYLLDNMRFLTTERPGRQVQSVKPAFYDREEAELAAKVEGWSGLSEQERHVHRLAYIRAYYMSGEIPLRVFAEALVWSWARTLLSPGSNWAYATATGTNPDSAGEPPRWLVAILLAFTVAARLLGAMGLVELLRTRRYDLLVSCAGLVAYFLAAHLFYGQSRYRVPIEPELAVFAALGWALCWDAWRRRRQADPRPVPLHS